MRLTVAARRRRDRGAIARDAVPGREDGGAAERVDAHLGPGRHVRLLLEVGRGVLTELLRQLVVADRRREFGVHIGRGLRLLLIDRRCNRIAVQEASGEDEHTADHRRSDAQLPRRTLAASTHVHVIPRHRSGRPRDPHVGKLRRVGGSAKEPDRRLFRAGRLDRRSRNPPSATDKGRGDHARPLPPSDLPDGVAAPVWREWRVPREEGAVRCSTRSPCSAAPPPGSSP